MVAARKSGSSISARTGDVAGMRPGCPTLLWHLGSLGRRHPVRALDRRARLPGRHHPFPGEEGQPAAPALSFEEQLAAAARASSAMKPGPAGAEYSQENVDADRQIKRPGALCRAQRRGARAAAHPVGTRPIVIGWVASERERSWCCLDRRVARRHDSAVGVQRQWERGTRFEPGPCLWRWFRRPSLLLGLLLGLQSQRGRPVTSHEYGSICSRDSPEIDVVAPGAMTVSGPKPLICWTGRRLRGVRLDGRRSRWMFFFRGWFPPERFDFDGLPGTRAWVRLHRR